MKKPAFSREAHLGARVVLDRLDDISRRYLEASNMAPNGNGSVDLMRGSLLAQVRAEIMTDLGIPAAPASNAGIDQVAPGREIAIHAMRFTGPVMAGPAGDAPVLLPAGERAARLAEGLRGSVIEHELQPLSEREDGTCLLTGMGPKREVLLDLERAGLDRDTLDILWSWSADSIAIDFVDGRI